MLRSDPKSPVRLTDYHPQGVVAANLDAQPEERFISFCRFFFLAAMKPSIYIQASVPVCDTAAVYTACTTYLEVTA